MGNTCALFLLPWIAAAQLTSNSVTVTVSRNASVPFDQVMFSVSLVAPVETSFDEAVAAVSAAGVTAANFTGVVFPTTSIVPAQATWSFQLAVPITDMQKTIGLLQAVQTSIAKEKKYAFSFRVAGGSPSADAAQNQGCSPANLIADARTQAASLAGAADVTIGAVQSLTSSTAGCAVTARFALGGGTSTAGETVTIAAATPASSAAPSRFVVMLDVGAEAGTSFDEVLRVASAAGASAVDLVGITQPVTGRICIMAPCNPVEWLFRYSAPLAKWKDTVAVLRAISTGKHPGVTVSYSFSPDAPAAPECATPTLLSQAQKRASEFAAAAGLRAGPVSSMAFVPAPAVPSSIVPALNPISVFDPGLANATPFLVGVLTPSPVPVPGCGVVAQFPLLH